MNVAFLALIMYEWIVHQGTKAGGSKGMVGPMTPSKRKENHSTTLVDKYFKLFNGSSAAGAAGCRRWMSSHLFDRGVESEVGCA